MASGEMGLLDAPHRRIRLIKRYVAAMYSRGVLVHRLCRLSAAISILAGEIPSGDGVFTKWTSERRKTVHHFDAVMSHSFHCRLPAGDESERKFFHE
jgi:hypothetical protein